MQSVIIRTREGDTVCTTEDEVNKLVSYFLKRSISGKSMFTIHKVFGECNYQKVYTCDHQMKNRTTEKRYCINSRKTCGNCFEIGGNVVSLVNRRRKI